MKNIHILPTDQPSRLHYYNNTKDYGTASHLYIISDEKIKKDEYYLGDDNHIYNLVTSVNNNGKKIILTTDPTLIADGVQSIDDEFLEWFVKNISCEFVEVKKRYSEFTVDPFVGYKIIIPQEEQVCPECEEQGLTLNLIVDFSPQEEPKQDSTEEWKELEDAKLCEPLKSWDEPKQETLEEAAERVFPTDPSVPIENLNKLQLIKHLNNARKKEGFIKGGKHVAERMYSEKDLRQAFRDGQSNMHYSDNFGLDSSLTEQQWFEQFKKK